MSHFATNWAIQQRGLKPTTKIVLWHLCDRHNPDFGCFPTQARLAADCELSRSALNGHLQKLESAGLIHRKTSIDPVTKRQQPTRYLLGFEDSFAGVQHDPSPESGHGNMAGSGGPLPDAECGPVPPIADIPCAHSGHGAVSGFTPDPCPENRQSRVRNPDTNLVREPLREPVKEEEGARAREDRFEEFFDALLDALGLDRQTDLPCWWQGWPPREHVRRWKDDLGLSEARILTAARESRKAHPKPPDGPRALDRVMERATRAGLTQNPGRKARRQTPANRPHWDPDARAAFFADWVNGDRYLPSSAISNEIRDAMLMRGLVTRDRLRERRVI